MLNRAMKRANKIKTKEAVYTLTKSQIEKIKLEATENAVEQSITLLLALPVRILKEHYKFSRKKLENFCSFVSEEYDKIDLINSTLEEYKQLLYNEVGVKFDIQ